MNNVLKLALPLLALVLIGCDERRVHVIHAEERDTGRDFVPYLKAFHIIDTYGVDTALDPGEALTFDPYYDAGLFEVDWRVNSLEDYQVSVRVNDRASIHDSQEVYTEICGEGLPCDQEAIRLCQYYPDLTMACGLDEQVTDISLQIHSLPQKLYTFLEVCDLDSNYCEYDYYPVWVE